MVPMALESCSPSVVFVFVCELHDPALTGFISNIVEKERNQVLEVRFGGAFRSRSWLVAVNVNGDSVGLT